MRATTPQRDPARSNLSVLFMVGLIAASFWIVRHGMVAPAGKQRMDHRSLVLDDLRRH